MHKTLLPAVTTAAAIAMLAGPATASAALAAAGRAHRDARPAAAARSAGALRAWGYNNLGQLGDGTTASAAVPRTVALPPGSTVAAVRAGCYSSVAVTSTGRVLTWGAAVYGQLGDGSTTPVDVPVRAGLPAGARVTSVRAGCDHVLALTSTGRIYAWGYNADGEVGNGTTSFGQDTPVRVHMPAGSRVTAISAGCYHSLAVTSTGRVYAWGLNSDGELGDGSTASNALPVRVRFPAGARIATITAGCYHSLAISATGRIFAWGDNEFGQLGDGTTVSRHRPVRASFAAPVTGLFAGCNHTLVLTRTGRVYGWGENDFGQLGDGTAVDSATPVRAKLPAGVRPAGIAAGCNHSLALTSTGRVYGWGYNNDGELGDASTTASYTPVRAHLPAGVTATGVAAGPGSDHSFAITRG